MAAVAMQEVNRTTALAVLGSLKVLVETTGNHSETRKTVPITKHSGSKKRVVMSMGPHKLPSLRVGDRLKLTAELQVTDDCIRREPRCAGRPYLFNPVIGSKLILASDRHATGGGRAMALSHRKVTRCRQKLPGRQHHCVVVFTHTSLDVTDRGALPCALNSCRVNFVLDAHNRQARHGDLLVIGANKPDGRVLQDKGRINAIRLHPGPQPAPPTLETTRGEAGVPLDQRPTVVLSRRLRGLEKNEQLAVQARMKADVSNLPYSTRVTTHLILADSRNSTSIGRRAARMASLRGEIAESNGSNCTTVQTPCPYTKVGVLRMRRDADRPLYVNLYVVSNPKRASTRSGDQLKVLRGASMQVARYPASAEG